MAFGENGQWVCATIRRLDYSGNLHPEILKKLKSGHTTLQISRLLNSTKLNIMANSIYEKNVELSLHDAEDCLVEFADMSTVMRLPSTWSLGAIIVAYNALTGKHRQSPGRVSRNYEVDAKTAV